MIRRFVVALLLPGLFILATGKISRGDMIAASPVASGATALATSDRTWGWEFTVNTPIEVTKLGMFDLFADGIPPVPVGIWTAGGTPIVSTLVTGLDPFEGTTLSGPGFSGLFRYHALSSPVPLNPGVYRIGADVASESFVWRAAGVVVGGPEITAGVPVYNPSTTSFAFPFQAFPADSWGYFGPNFQYQLPVPEPSTLVLAACGTLAAGIFSRRRRRLLPSLLQCVIPIGFTIVGLISSDVLAAAIYTFDGTSPVLSAGTLAGQDNWRSVNGSPVIATGVGINTTKVAKDAQPSPGVVSRINDSQFSFPAFLGTETSATLQFDARHAIQNSSGGTVFGLGYDSDSNLTLGNTVSEIGPTFGIQGGAFMVFPAGGAAQIVGSPAVFGSWYQLQFVMDFTANGGSGSGSLFSRNLTLGETTFTSIAGLSAVNLNLIGGPTPTSWDGLYLRVSDILGGNDMSADNLTIVPEPSTAVMALTALGALLYRRRVRRSFFTLVHGHHG